jgi:hypothetical protein
MGVIFPVLPRLAPGVAGLDVTVVPLTIPGDEAKGRRLVDVAIAKACQILVSR